MRAYCMPHFFSLSSIGDVTMQLPPADPETLFEELLHDLPPETGSMAREFKAFARARKIKPPEPLLRVVLLYCGVDKALREVAGILTALYEPITDQAVAERLRACGPWIKAVLRKMLPPPVVTALPQPLRFVVIDATTVQAPGATGTDYRLHISLDLVALEFLEVSISDVHTGETLTYGSPIFKAVPKKRCKALYRALKKSPKSPELAVGAGSEPSYVDRSVGAP